MTLLDLRMEGVWGCYYYYDDNFLTQHSLKTFHSFFHFFLLSPTPSLSVTMANHLPYTYRIVRYCLKI